jgi:hypothetical protein
MPFENRRSPLAPYPVFLRRVAKCLGLALAVLAAALAIGVFGYHACAGLDWIDALLNAAMILTGMGPVDPMRTTAAKLFASGYALFSGVVFITVMGLIIGPIVHRVLHRFHIDEDDLRRAEAHRQAPPQVAPPDRPERKG